MSSRYSLGVPPMIHANRCNKSLGVLQVFPHSMQGFTCSTLSRGFQQAIKPRVVEDYKGACLSRTLCHIPAASLQLSQ